jgi:hypothetical protein
MDSNDIKTYVKARLLLEESKKKKRWNFHMVKNPNMVYKEKTMQFDSTVHHGLLKKTLEHLLALRDAYASGSATRHVISQTCTRLKRLINKLEK